MNTSDQFGKEARKQDLKTRILEQLNNIKADAFKPQLKEVNLDQASLLNQLIYVLKLQGKKVDPQVRQFLEHTVAEYESRQALKQAAEAEETVGNDSAKENLQAAEANQDLEPIQAAADFLKAKKHWVPLILTAIKNAPHLGANKIDKLLNCGKGEFVALFEDKDTPAQFYDSAVIWQRANPGKKLSEFLGA